MPKGEYLQYGGQAILDGVMMRSPRFFSVACRAPNDEIVVTTEEIEKTWIGRQRWLKLPFLRGSLAILDTMALGSKAMRFAAALHMAPEYQPPDASGNGRPTAAATETPKRVQDVAVGASMLLGLLIGLGLFVYLPNLVAELWQRAVGRQDFRIVNVVAEVVKVSLFLGYLWLIGRIHSVAETFRYHGAEHKAIRTLEAGEPLRIENCLRQTRLHPRCGTSFAILVLLLGLILFTFVPRYPFGRHAFPFVDTSIRFLIEVVILPIIAGVAYEVIRIAGRMRNAALVNVLLAPGLSSQYLTTREPETRHVEVALAALRACVDAEEGSVPIGEEPEPNALESAPPAVA